MIPKIKKIFNSKKLLSLLLLVTQLGAFFSFLSIPQTANAATTTITYVGTANDLGGAYPWTSVTNAIGNTTSTSANSSVTGRNNNTNQFALTNFNLSGAGLPAGATINGIQVDVERQVSERKMKDFTVQLTKDGTSGVGSNYGNSANGPTTKTISTYGGLADLWGTTWAYGELTSSNFGVILEYRNTANGSRNVDVFRVGITIDYTPNSPPTDITLSSQNIDTGLPIGSLVGTMTTTDPDPSDTHTYTFTCGTPGADDSSFSISGSNLQSAEVFDYFVKSSYDICIRTDDGYGGTFDKNFTITINPPQPGPGGVSSNLEVWLKSDAGTSTTTDGARVTSWADQSGNALDATTKNPDAPDYRDNATDNLNFRPVVDFNGVDDFMENLSNGAYSHSYFAVIVPDNTVDGTLAGQVPFGWDCLSGVLSSGTCGLNYAGVTLGAFTIAINDEVITHAIGSSANRRGAQIGVASYQAGKPMLIGTNENSSANNSDIYEKGSKVDNFSVNTYQTLSTADYNIGRSPDATYPYYFDGKIAEIINYSGRVSDTDRQKIESYLSIKYGMTLQSGTQNYIASNGSTNMWSTAVAGTYINDIFGVGRDDTGMLGQVKSQSVEDDGIIVLEAVGEGTNLAPSYVDIADYEFLTISNDGGGNTWTALDAPATYNILTRKWRVQEIGEVGTVNLDFDVDDADFDVPPLGAGTNYYYIYDSDNDNSLADETPVAMTNTVGSIWQIAGTDIDHTREFTIATEASSNNIPTDIQLSNDTIDENVASGSTVGVFTTTDADVGDTHTYSFVSGAGDADNNRFTISGSTLNIGESPDYELQNTYNIRVETDDGNGGQYQEAFVINISDLPEVLTTIIDFETSGKYTVTSGIWNRNTVNPNEGLYSVESDNGGLDNTQSCFEVTHTLSATGTIDFDYNVSSEAGSDFLRFYIDNIEQQNWSGTVPWATYNKNDIAAGQHDYKWCYIKDGGGSAGTDNAYIDYITYQNTAVDSTPPSITAINFASGSLLPGGNHNIIIDYNDAETGIDTSSDVITVNKWDGLIWGPDIAATALDLGSKVITATGATYPTNNMDSGKYRYNFQISDNNANSSSTGATFYIDIPELIVSTGSFDAGTLPVGALSFSTDEIIITVKTVGAGFDVQLSKDSTFTFGTGGIIIDWDGLEGVGYDKDPYSGTNLNIPSNPVIATQVASIDPDGFVQTYTYKIKIGTLIDEQQAAGNYTMSLSFYAIIDY